MGEQTFGVNTVNNSIISIATTVIASGDTPDETRDEKEETTFSHSLPVLSADPASYAGRRMTAQNINLILSFGCFQPADDFRYPKTYGRQCNKSFFHGDLPDGRLVKRQWLSYSCRNDRLYCVVCCLFGGIHASELWTTCSYSSWSNAARDLKAHEASEEHRAAELAAIKWSCKQKCAVAGDIVKQNNTMVDENRKVVRVLIDCCKFLATENLAFRGHSSQEGKLLNLFHLLGRYDVNAAAYTQRLQYIQLENQKRPHVNFLSPLNQRRLIHVMALCTVEVIANRIRQQGRFSIISDSTQDVSKKEVSALLVRYLEDDKNGQLHPVERLIGIFCSTSTSGEALKDHVCQLIDDASLTMDLVVGQSYDGAGNMRGQHSGLQSRIQKLCPKAVYIWCYAHRLSLVVSHVLGQSSRDVKVCMGTLEELHTFLVGYKRHAVFMDEIDKLGLPRLQIQRTDTTRQWSSAERAVCAYMRVFPAILNTLDRFSTDGDMDSATMISAGGLKKKLTEFSVVLSVHVIHEIVQETGPVSRQLQAADCDLSQATTIIRTTLKKFCTKTGDVKWLELLKKTKAFCCKHDISTKQPSVRSRKKKRMNDETVEDESLIGEERLKVDVWYASLDAVICQMKERFGDHQLQLLDCIAKFSPRYLTAQNKDYKLKSEEIAYLCEIYGLDSTEVAAEMNSFQSVFLQCRDDVDLTDVAAEETAADEYCDAIPEHTGSIDSDGDDDCQTAGTRASFLVPLRILCCMSAYPNLLVLYKILLSLPISNCSAERSMSRLKLIKTRLRSTMSDEMLHDLMILSSEKDILDNLDIDVIINRFANTSVQLSRYLIPS